MNQEPPYPVYVKSHLNFLMQILSGSQALFCPLYGNQIPELRKFCLWNLESWGLESGIQLQESRVLLTTGIRNPSCTDKESQIQYLESEIHCVESGIQYRLGLPYTGDLLKDGCILSASGGYPTNLHAMSILQYQSSATKISLSYSTAGQSFMQ